MGSHNRGYSLSHTSQLTASNDGSLLFGAPGPIPIPPRAAEEVELGAGTDQPGKNMASCIGSIPGGGGGGEGKGREGREATDVGLGMSLNGQNIKIFAWL